MRPDNLGDPQPRCGVGGNYPDGLEHFLLNRRSLKPWGNAGAPGPRPDRTVGTSAPSVPECPPLLEADPGALALRGTRESLALGGGDGHGVDPRAV